MEKEIIREIRAEVNKKNRFEKGKPGDRIEIFFENVEQLKEIIEGLKEINAYPTK